MLHLFIFTCISLFYIDWSSLFRFLDFGIFDVFHGRKLMLVKLEEILKEVQCPICLGENILSHSSVFSHDWSIHINSCVCVLDTSCLLVQTHLLVNCSTIIWLPCIIYIHVIFYGSPQMLKVREFHCLICIIFYQMMIIWLPCIIYIHVIFYGSPQMLEVREFHCLICIIFC